MAASEGDGTDILDRIRQRCESSSSPIRSSGSEMGCCAISFVLRTFSTRHSEAVCDFFRAARVPSSCTRAVGWCRLLGNRFDHAAPALGRAELLIGDGARDGFGGSTTLR